MKTIIEKERKWLLKGLPDDIWDNCIERRDIQQFYTEDGWRYRREAINDSEYKYCRLKKIAVERGINHEIDIEEITENEYDNAYVNSPPLINKWRYVIKHEGKRIEIDEFSGLSLIIAEVEDVDMDDVVVFPEEVEKLILMEVTGNSKFSNYNLAEKEDMYEL